MQTSTHSFLLSFAGVLSTAALTTVCFQKLRWPVVLGYLLAGVLLGPQQLGGMLGVVNAGDVQIMAELGVVLLMFCIGLEFSLADLLRAGGRSAVVALFGMGTMLWLGYLCARLLGFTPLLSVFVASMLAISSTTLVLRVLDDEAIQDRVRSLLLGLLVVEDLVAILLLALLTTLATTQNFSVAEVASSAGRLALFLLALIGVGLLLVPRGMRAVLALQREETVLVASLGFAFLLAMLAIKMGYSAALGAFFAGSLIAQAGAGKGVEALVLPVRNVFVAVFFVAVGMSMDLGVIAQMPWTVLLLSAAVLIGKGIGVAAGAFAVGANVRDALRAGMCAGQIGEFSFIIAAIAISIPGAEKLAAIAVAVSALTATISPILARYSIAIASFVERKLPHPVQNFASLYASWLSASQLASASNQSLTRRLRSLLTKLLLDLLLVVAVIILAAVFDDRLASFVDQRTDWAALSVRAVVFAICLLPLLPLLFGAVRLIRGFAQELASAAMPKRANGEVDFASAPRRVFVLAIEIGVSTAAFLLVLSLTQPFLTAGLSALVAATLLLLLGIAFWQSAKQLHGHMRAGASALLEILQMQRPAKSKLVDVKSPVEQPVELSDAEALMPGIGSLHAVQIGTHSIAVGKTLSELDIRAQTGASVLLIRRGETALLQPGGSESVCVGDDLVLSGELSAVQRAEDLLLEQRV
jgi:monovalent cation:H+ antiporter-2, CPA2 family